MDQLSISQLARFSGIKAHTIRMWEQRYNALTPNRSEGNTRYYDNDQLRRLLNIVSLSQGEHKISELCSMPDKRLFRLIEERQIKAADEMEEYFIAQIIMAGMAYNEAHFDKIFSHSLMKYGMRDTYLKIIYPVLERMGLMWSSDTLPPANEHFISNLFHQKLYTAIDALPPPETGSASWLLFLPENEFHDIGLLFAHYLIRSHGKKVIYLGSNVPAQSLYNAVKETSPANLLLFLVHKNQEDEEQQYLNALNSRFKGKKIFVATAPGTSNTLKARKDFYTVHSVEDLERLLLTATV